MHIIKILSEDKYISGNEIGRILGISRAAVHKQIKILKNKGYLIESSPQGYKLIKSFDLLNEYEILSHIQEPLSIPIKIKHYHKISSTQTKLKELAEKGADEGIILVADEQTDAYGRMKRTWYSSNGGLWFSMLLKPQIAPDEVSKLAIIISIIIKRVLENKYKVKSLIKWPNDILCENRKIAGILIEMSAEYDIVNRVIIGIGININNILPDNLKEDSIALKDILKEHVSRAEFLAEFLKEFDTLYKNFKKYGLQKILQEYNQSAAFINKIIKIERGYDIIVGVHRGINSAGRLIVETNEGLEEIISGTLRRS